jgi:hypothetical protein
MGQHLRDHGWRRAREPGRGLQHERSGLSGQCAALPSCWTVTSVNWPTQLASTYSFERDCTYLPTFSTGWPAVATTTLSALLLSHSKR